MIWAGRFAAICVAFLSASAGRPDCATSTSLDLPREAFKSPVVESGAMQANVALSEVSLELDLSRFRTSSAESFVIAHLRRMLTPELERNFDLFLYISKATSGPYAQRMHVVRKAPNGPFRLIRNWPVSTGRERLERNALGVERFTSTLPGYYELDPERMFANYHSIRWDEPMPYAMFFDAVYKGERVGLAIHATDEKENLGSRASAGCVRLSLADARELFQMIAANYGGDVPLMAYDSQTKTTRRDGSLMRDAQGKLVFRKGYRVLVIIENFGGAEIAMQ